LTLFHVFHRVGFLALLCGLLLTASPVLAQDENAVDTDEAAAEEVSYLLVELLGRAKMVGYPAVCPGSSPDDDQSEIVCIAELYEAPARVIDHLGGAKTSRRLNIRFTAHSYNVVWKRNRRFLLSVIPFNDKGREGYFAFNWDWENDKREFCVLESGLSDTAEPLQKFFKNGRRHVTTEKDESWSEGLTIRCAKGRLGRRR